MYRDMIQKIYVSAMIPAFLKDLETCYQMIFFSVALSFITSTIYIEVMSIFAEAISWLCIILVQFSLIAASIGSWFLQY